MFKELLNNWKMKLLAVLMAGLSYYLIRDKTSEKVSLEVPLMIQVEKGIAILEQDPTKVSVSFRGAPQDLVYLNKSNIRAVVRLKASEVSGSEKTIGLSERNIEGAVGAVPVSINPTRAIVRFDREAERVYKLAPPLFRGAPLQGRAVVADYEPKTVLMRGPERRLQSAEAFLDPIDVEGRSEGFATTVKIRSGDPWITEITPSTANVKVSIVRDTASRVIKSVPVIPLIGKDFSSVTIEPRNVDLLVSGAAEIIAGIPDAAFRAFIDCVGLEGMATYELPVHAYSPSKSEVSIVSEPSIVRVTIGSR